MNEDEFLARWHAERPMFEAWGSFVVERIAESLKAQLSQWDVDLFLRIPVKPRTKADGSLIEKAFYRKGKSYTSPYDEITDKIGVRYVVLLQSDIEVISKCIEEDDFWIASKDRDFEAEQALNPIQFDYAAVHFVVRSKSHLTHNGVTIAANTPCEVQIKNILQHAYSELTHDTIYKPKVDATPQMRRNAAKSMALIEATNDYFQAVKNQVAQAIQPSRVLSDGLGVIYAANVGIPPLPTRLEGLLLDAFDSGSNDEEVIRRVTSLLEARSYLGQRIRERAESWLLFRQPSILLVYDAAIQNPSATKAIWPLTADELRPIYTDLGISLDAV